MRVPQPPHKAEDFGKVSGIPMIGDANVKLRFNCAVDLWMFVSPTKNIHTSSAPSPYQCHENIQKCMSFNVIV